MKINKNLLIFAICYISYTAIYIARLNLSMATPGMIEIGIADAAGIGFLGSCFSVIYSFGRLINGVMSDRTPPWIMLCSGLLLAGLSNICIGFFPPFAGIIVLWGANAFAQSMLWSSVLCVISEIYGEKAKKASSYIVTSVAVGNLLGIVINTVLITKLGLGFAFIVPGGLTLVCGALVFLSVRKIRPAEEKDKKHFSMLKLLKMKEMKLSLLPAMFHGMMKDNISLWMTVYFVDRFNVNLSESAYFILLIPVMGFIGRILYPFCYKLCGEDEHKVSVVGFVSCAILAMPLCFDTSSPILAAVALSLIYTAVSLINTSMLSIYPIRLANSGNVASVSGIMDFATYLGAGIGSFVYGIMIKNMGSYVPMYITWAIVSLASLPVLIMMRKASKKI